MQPCLKRKRAASHRQQNEAPQHINLTLMQQRTQGRKCCKFMLRSFSDVKPHNKSALSSLTLAWDNSRVVAVTYFTHLYNRTYKITFGLLFLTFPPPKKSSRGQMRRLTNPHSVHPLDSILKVKKPRVQKSPVSSALARKSLREKIKTSLRRSQNKDTGPSRVTNTDL